MKNQILARMIDCGVVAVIRAPSDAVLPDIARALIAGGVVAIEVTMTTPNALHGIEHLRGLLGDEAVVGVGTVLDAATCQDAIHAGAQFVVSPVFNAAVVDTAKKHEIVSIPGAFTPTEILAAWNAGADVVKVFPATSLGPAYFKDLLAPMPFLKLTPTGGVDVKSTTEWIKAGAVCVGAGSSLVSKEMLAKSDWNGMTAIAKEFIQAVRKGRG